jgi:hypothetical protein
MNWLTRKLPEKMKTVPPPADPNTTIWRYTNIKAFETLMTDKCLMFHQFKELQESDEREGMVPEGFWESMMKFLREQNPEEDAGKLREMGEAALDKIRCFEYASCWIMSDAESAQMWKDFAPRGIAIRTTVGRFTDAKKTAPNPPGIRSQIIEYADHWSELEARGYRHNGVSLNRLFLHTKRKKFAHENEIRFRVHPAPTFRKTQDGNLASANPSECKPWCPVVFQTLDWIEEIVAASSISLQDAESMRQCVEQKGLTFMRSRL